MEDSMKRVVSESPVCSTTTEEIPRVFRRNRAQVRNATVCAKPRENVQVDRISSRLDRALPAKIETVSINDRLTTVHPASSLPFSPSFENDCNC